MRQFRFLLKIYIFTYDSNYYNIAKINMLIDCAIHKINCFLPIKILPLGEGGQIFSRT